MVVGFLCSNSRPWNRKYKHIKYANDHIIPKVPLWVLDRAQEGDELHHGLRHGQGACSSRGFVSLIHVSLLLSLFMVNWLMHYQYYLCKRLRLVSASDRRGASILNSKSVGLDTLSV